MRFKASVRVVAEVATVLVLFTSTSVVAARDDNLQTKSVGGSNRAVETADTAHPFTTRDDAVQTSQKSTDDTVIEEIVVTARRREEFLEKVPLSVSAFGENRIEELQADNISGLQYSVPNLHLDVGDASNAVISIRGIGQNDSLAFADPGVGVYVDDVFIARTQASFLDLFDVQRVEVLRGPQGTLYGRNTIGGAVKFVSTVPGDHFEAYAETGGGNFGTGLLKGRISGPLIDGSLRGKFAFSLGRRNGFAHDSVSGNDDGDNKSFGWRGSLFFTPSDELSLLLSYDGKISRPDTSRSPVRQTPVNGFPDPIGDPANLVTFPPNVDNFRVDVNANGLSDITSQGVTFKATWDASASWSLESITAYRHLNFDLNLDVDGTPLKILDVLLLENQDQVSQELRATFTPMEALTAIIGVYYFHDFDDTFSGFDDLSASLFGFPITAFGLPNGSIADTRQKTDSIAEFFDASYSLTEQLSVSIGLRHTHEKKRSGRRFENFFDRTLSIVTDRPPFLAGVGVPGVVLSGRKSFNAITPRFTISYQVIEPVMVYASAARGFKSGGFDGRAASDFAFQPFRPEFVWSYEVGIKSTWLDHRLIANAGFFYNNYKDLQVTSFGADPDSGAFVSLFTNAARARTEGVEVELTARPTEALSVNATLGYLDSKYRKFETLVAGIVTDVSGRPLVNAPKWNSSLSMTYAWSVSEQFDIAVHVDGNYRSRTFTEITASDLLDQGAYFLGNAFVSLKTSTGRWEVRAGVKNLSDRELRVQGFNLSEFPGEQLNFFGSPRTYDLRLFYRY